MLDPLLIPYLLPGHLRLGGQPPAQLRAAPGLSRKMGEGRVALFCQHCARAPVSSPVRLAEIGCPLQSHGDYEMRSWPKGLWCVPDT